jgi:hypothetical protein
MPTISPLAGTPPPSSMLANIPRLEAQALVASLFV